jgi:hypothetical protein
MPTTSLRERIEWLERELPPNPPRFRVHEELPFAVLVYEPEDEWTLRKEVRHLATRLEGKGRKVVFVSLADLLWKAIEATDGIEALVRLERERGFDAAEKQANTYLSDPELAPLPEALARELAGLDPELHLCFVVRTAAMAPNLFPVSKLLENLQGKTRVPTILFYPGSVRDGALVFMNLPGREPLGSYRVKIYA